MSSTFNPHSSIEKTWRVLPPKISASYLKTPLHTTNIPKRLSIHTHIRSVSQDGQQSIINEIINVNKIIDLAPTCLGMFSFLSRWIFVGWNGIETIQKNNDFDRLDPNMWTIKLLKFIEIIWKINITSTHSIPQISRRFWRKNEKKFRRKFFVNFFNCVEPCVN